MFNSVAIVIDINSHSKLYTIDFFFFFCSINILLSLIDKAYKFIEWTDDSL